MTADENLIRVMVRACEEILLFAGKSDAAFQADRKSQAAVMHRLLIVDDAAKRVSEATKSAYHWLPWAKCARLRDRLAHDLFKIDIRSIWATATVDVPALLAELQQL